MKKLALKLEDLSVDSFDTVGARDKKRGTVVAHDTEKSVCWGCNPEQTRYEYSCQSCSGCKECTETCGFTICIPF